MMMLLVLRYQLRRYWFVVTVIIENQDVRLWDDEKGKPWSKSVMDMGYEVLLVSQFTLFGSIKRNS